MGEKGQGIADKGRIEARGRCQKTQSQQMRCQETNQNRKTTTPGSQGEQKPVELKVDGKWTKRTSSPGGILWVPNLQLHFHLQPLLVLILDFLVDQLLEDLGCGEGEMARW